MSGDATSRERHAATLLTLYKRVLSPLFHIFVISQCKYLPTCSEYAYSAVVRYGWLRGGWLAIRRVGRCHPWAEGRHDPVP
jgi:putative membrane protein insertion efficiency factor